MGYSNATVRPSFLPSVRPSVGFQTFLRTKCAPSLIKIHWRMLILEYSQGCYRVTIRPCDLDRWPMILKIRNPIDFQGHRSRSPGQIFETIQYAFCHRKFSYKIHWRMLILECSQGCYGRMDGRTVALLYPFSTSLARENTLQKNAE
jgi:hypothetical protein